MGIYTNGKPRFGFIEAIIKAWKKAKEEAELEEKFKDTTCKNATDKK